MAQFDVIVNFTLAHEGGISRSKTDSASKNPAPCKIQYKGEIHSDFHTNKGITWTTFKSNAAALGYEPSCQNFAHMPHTIWMKIAKRIYWDYYNLDSMPSQAIANLLFQSAWGSGLTGSLNFWNGYFQKSFTNGSQLSDYIQQLLKKQSQEHLFNSMWTARLRWLTSLPGQSANYAGWTRRANDLKALSEPYLKQTAGTNSPVGFLMAALALFGAYKAGEYFSKR